jgi:predicted nucleic acid-binding protein
MKTLKIYLETSVLNFYHAEDAPEKMEDTRRLFDEINNGKYLAFISMSVIKEISKAPQGKQRTLFGLIRDYRVVVLEDEIEAERIADIYVKEGVIPAKYSTDGLHIALATIHDMDIIVSWNFAHIVKRKTILMTNLINNREGYKSIDIYSPSEVIESNEE